MKKQFTQYITEMLKLAREAVLKSPMLVTETGTLNTKGQRSIEMDVRIEKLFIDYIKRNNIAANIFSEEIGVLNFHPNPKFIVAFDPLDGSTNYRVGNRLLPFGTLIAFYNGITPNLGNILAAGTIEYTRDLAWIYDGEKTTDLNGNKIILKKEWQVHRSTPAYLDLYYKEAYEKYRPLAQQISIRNTGSTIGNLSFVLSDVASIIGAVCMRSEEIGAVYALIKGAGGTVVDHEGQDLDILSFAPETKYPILGGAKNIVEFCVNQIKGKKLK